MDDLIEIRSLFWASGVIEISNYYHTISQTCSPVKVESMMREKTKKFLLETYAFETNDVFFKPTCAINPRFCNSLEEAIDYFCGSVGFVTNNHWTDINFVHSKTKNIGDQCFSMGSYCFTGINGNTIDAEYTFIYNSDGKVLVHHSSIPFNNI